MTSSNRHLDLLSNKTAALLFVEQESDIDELLVEVVGTSTKSHCDAFEMTEVIVACALCDLCLSHRIMDRSRPLDGGTTVCRLDVDSEAVDLLCDGVNVEVLST